MVGLGLLHMGEAADSCGWPYMCMRTAAAAQPALINDWLKEAITVHMYAHM